MTNKTLLDDPRYYLALYRESLKEIESSLDPDVKLYFPKWKRDVLLSLLERAKPNVKRKFLRKKVSLDLKRISDEAWKELIEEST